MPPSLTLVTPVDQPSTALPAAEPPPPFPPGPALARVIEIGEVAAGIAVPEEKGVRFFSASRDFDGLDGQLFRSPEQAARAVRELTRPGARKAPRPVAV
ncbi:hypothetical protein [Methylobacterium sp. J-076]|uniref:hypothetical protein n=1 Tax=Methylobacterium sp. J-076 TaxID=2836655 RepID=UPI001FB905FB|nr:hypothetical protein [Methylobacterium sp. J-076]MCJ2014557.1 hypothetical protein [Methylobacterium sp. J-076]